MYNLVLYNKKVINFRFWQIETSFSGTSYRTSYGVCDISRSNSTTPFATGLVTTSEWTDVEGKNANRANATTDEEQTMLCVERLAKKKMEVGYMTYDDIKTSIESSAQPNNTSAQSSFKPMLAEKYESDNIRRLTTPDVFLQPKLDGVRCIMTREAAVSRSNKKFFNVENVYSKFMKLIPDGIYLDGELYIPNSHIGSVISDIGQAGVTNNLSTEMISRYYIFDIYDSNKPDMIFSDRWIALHSMLINILGNTDYNSFYNDIEKYKIKIVPTKHIRLTTTASTQSEGKDDNTISIYAFNDYINNSDISTGYEGLMIRVNKPYECKRSFNILKMKWLYADREFKVVDLQEGVGAHSGLASTALILMTYTEDDINRLPFLKDIPPDTVCRISVNGTLEDRRKYLVNKQNYIGTYATVEYQDITYPNGLLRFGKLKCFRNYE